MSDPLNGAIWRVDQGDVIEWLASLPADSADLLVCSPPYQEARLYLESGEDLGIARDTEAWVSWMMTVCLEARRVVKGLCVFVVEGQTRHYRYSCSPFLLMADLHRRGFHLRKPCVYRRVGIPGSGGPDWLRNDWEPIVCFARGGKLPWSDNTCMGHPPKWAPGGEMSNRLPNGTRVNQWGMRIKADGSIAGTERGGDGGGNKDELKQRTRRPSHETLTVGEPEPGVNLFGEVEEGKPSREEMTAQLQEAKARHPEKSQRQPAAEIGYPAKISTSGTNATGTITVPTYIAPVLANPGNIIDCKVGGGLLGSKLAHENEAPYPEQLVEFFVRSFAEPGSIVIDPFSGSGTTGAVAVRWGRRFLGCDLRQSQVDLSRRRISAEVDMFHVAGGTSDGE